MIGFSLEKEGGKKGKEGKPRGKGNGATDFWVSGYMMMYLPSSAKRWIRKYKKKQKKMG